ncbi:DUF305 domain-containing protein [Cellulosimicrobium marinum]|uniref:DUF305 domain-containing protein n=1 Tax=Cellulosimicrobium marinum TaxID=1638992 RepID=UPI001E3280CB|nr:DUF305 domain-containing protein [Cellulosimicrobium marinum]MCB7136023.1 DUF305 domain-containing protein [Cellulosimicrobium marinum]
MARPARARALTCVVVLAVLGTAACTGDPEPVVNPSSVVLQPGRPGDDTSTTAPEDFAGPLATGEWNQADVTFVTSMITHHLQALDMAALAPDRVASPEVATLAERITAAQGPEIHGLAAWLAERDLPVPAEAEQLDGTGPRVPATGHTHDHDGMAGMLSDAQMQALEDATGADFDRLFLEGMIQHHQGALDMADVVLVDGQDTYALEIAADTAAGQSAEIGRMQGLLDAL